MAFPEVGAILLFRDRHFGTSGHTGRVTDIVRGRIRIKTIDGRVKLVEVGDVSGWWPKHSKKHTQDRLVKP